MNWNLRDLSLGTKQIVTVVVALTALATSATSLVKALDKRVEQVSYETLSAKIVDLQQDNAVLHRRYAELSQTVKDNFTDYSEPSFALPPAAAASGVGVTVVGVGKPKNGNASPSIKTARPCASSDPLCVPVSASPAIGAASPGVPSALPPAPPAPHAPKLHPPPSWKDLKSRAEM